MASLFCSKCKTLNPPGAEKCRVCRLPLEEESDQSSLTDPAFRTQMEVPKVILETSKLHAPYFPYKPRAEQMSIVKDITVSLSSSKHIVLESGTGTGKTICSLAGGLHHAKMRGKKIIYLTRTISQSDQVMRELKNISEIKSVCGLTVTGRKKSCPLLKTISGYDDIPSHVLSTLCEERKTKSLRGIGGGCRFYDKVKPNIITIEDFVKKNFPTSGALDSYCESLGACPYEARKALMQSMDVIVAPYVHILSDDIRTNLLSQMKCEDDQILLIVDEAHNLIPAAREQESFSISVKDLDLAISEAESAKDPILFEDVRAKEFITYLKTVIKGAANDKLTLTSREAKIDSNTIESKIMSKFSLKANELVSAVMKMRDQGEARTEYLLDQGIHKLSELMVLGISLSYWFSASPDRFIKIVMADAEGEIIKASCIDPFDITAFIRSMKGAIHMSGTLQPLEQYVRTMGLPAETVTRIYPSPFPRENRSVVFVNDVTTKYDDMKRNPGIMDKMASYITKLCNSVDKNTLVFFPSYSMMSKMRPMVEPDIIKKMYWEDSGNQKRTMSSLEQFRSGRDGVFFTVMGGSIAEGIDFPGDELCFAIIVGVPYPPPTVESKAMSDMFDKKYGMGTGWAYASEVPALRKMKQAIGRLIRTEEDRGMAVILDSRATKYQKQLDSRLSKDVIADTAEFFR